MKTKTALKNHPLRRSGNLPAAPQIRIDRIYETSKGMFGIDAAGQVWAYQGHQYGWSKLNMSKCNAETKFGKRPDGYHQAEYDNDAYDMYDHDDIPF